MWGGSGKDLGRGKHKKYNMKKSIKSLKNENSYIKKSEFFILYIRNYIIEFSESKNKKNLASHQVMVVAVMHAF